MLLFLSVLIVQSNKPSIFYFNYCFVTATTYKWFFLSFSLIFLRFFHKIKIINPFIIYFNLNLITRSNLFNIWIQVLPVYCNYWIPQGSNLVPLLSNIFISDIFQVMNSSYLLYANDLKLFSSVSYKSVKDWQII